MNSWLMRILLDDHMSHRTEDGHVRPRLERQPHLSEINQLNATRINHDHLGAVLSPQLLSFARR